MNEVDYNHKELMDKLNEILEAIRELKTNPLPVQPQPYDPHPVDPQWPTIPTIPVPQPTRCGVCGLEIENLTGYVCNNTACPIFPRITC